MRRDSTAATALLRSTSGCARAPGPLEKCSRLRSGRDISRPDTLADIRAQIRDFALSLPEASEDYPWGEDVAKVRGKIFVFLGTAGSSVPRMTVKLVESHGHALSVEGAEPTGYGLGKSGWVTVPLEADGLDSGLLCDWIEESYRVVAPKSLVSELDRSVAAGDAE